MALKRQAAEDLWHLTIDDLLAAPVETPRLAGPAPFVVNLSSSTAPIRIPPAGIPGFSHLHLYQVSRTEDRRSRYRLRLGLFTTEAAVEEALPVLREHYPSAFAVSADADDLHIRRRHSPSPGAAATPTAPAPASTDIPTEVSKKIAKKKVKPAKATRPVTAAPIDLASEVEGILLAALAPPTSKSARAAMAATAEAVVEPAQTAAQSVRGAVQGAVQAATPPAVENPLDLPIVRPAIEDAPVEDLQVSAALADVPAAIPDEVITEEVPIITLPAGTEPITTQPEAPAATAEAMEPSALEVLLDFHALQRTLEDDPAESPPLNAQSAAVPPAEIAAQSALQANTAVKDSLAATDTAIDPQLVLSILESAPAESEVLAVSEPTIPAELPAPPVLRPPVVMKDAPPPDLDSTQTLRVLTPLELNDTSLSKWLVVELTLSEQPVDLEALPRLGIFAEYRLYAVTGVDAGKVLHSLRLGFFSEDLSAEVVAGYLRSFFPTAGVKRVSVAEHARFAAREATAAGNPLLAPSPGGVAPIVLETRQPLRTPVAQQAPQPQSAMGRRRGGHSLWSRLFGDDSKTGS